MPNKTGALAALGYTPTLVALMNPDTGELYTASGGSGTTTLGAGTASIGSVKIDGPIAGAITHTSRRVVAGANTNSTLVKTGAAALLAFTFSNTAATPAWVHFYDLATAPAVGTSATVLTVAVPAGQTVSFYPPFGIANFTLGLGYGITSGSASDTDATAMGGSTVVGILLYK